jgi:hypothetical protein
MKDGSNALTKIVKKEGFSSLIFILLSFLFFIITYGLFFYYYKKEEDWRKKYFLGLVTLYLFFYFIVMIFSIKAAPLRYFISVEFIPFLFLGFIFKFIIEKYQKNSWLILFLLLLFFSLTNLFSIGEMFKELSNKSRSSYKYSVLGEIEQMTIYMISESNPQKEAFLSGNRNYVSNLYKALLYIAKTKNFNLIRLSDKKITSLDIPLFYITQWKGNENESIVGGHVVENFKKFGQIVIYKIQN